ncbi:MAG TPA: thiamine-phosphate kinase [Polyangiaceae bacterium]|nr:thiamine-phosphate kinase [Polyangiaceae bacterium]
MLARILGANAPGLEVGIGDDAAVLLAEHARGRIVWTIDEQVEGSHFRRDWLSWRDIGWRSFMAAASDLAAMGAAPWSSLCALVLPDDVGDAALEQIALGQRDASAAVGAPVIGGNLARGATLSIATTLLGTCDRAVTRGGARPGDALWIAGPIGLSAAGLLALQAGRGSEPSFDQSVTAWRRPRALIAEGRAMGALAHAAVDVSDGLARDAGHIAQASGVQLVLDEAALRSDQALNEAAAALGVEPVDLALHGGEDYALVIASPAPVEGFRPIGEVRSGHGLMLRSQSGEQALEARGFDHFRK